MYLEYATNNAVLVTFVNLLARSLNPSGRREQQATPTRLYSIQDHDGDTENMVLESSGDGESGTGEFKGREVMEGGVLSSANCDLDVGKKTTAYSALPNHCEWVRNWGICTENCHCGSCAGEMYCLWYSLN